MADWPVMSPSFPPRCLQPSGPIRVGCSSMELSGRVAIQVPCSKRIPTIVFSRLTATRPPLPAGRTWWRPWAAGWCWSKPNSPRWKMRQQMPASQALTASCSISGFPRCSSTRRSAAFHSARTGPSTCAWRAMARARRTSSTQPARAASRTFSITMAKSVWRG